MAGSSRPSSSASSRHARLDRPPPLVRPINDPEGPDVELESPTSDDEITDADLIAYSSGPRPLQPTTSGIPSSPPPLLADPPIVPGGDYFFGRPSSISSADGGSASGGGGLKFPRLSGRGGRPGANKPTLVIPPVMIDGVTVPSPSPQEASPDPEDMAPSPAPLFHWPFATNMPIISPGFTHQSAQQQAPGSAGFTRGAATRADALAAAAAIVAGLGDDTIEGGGPIAAPPTLPRTLSREMSRELSRGLSRSGGGGGGGGGGMGEMGGGLQRQLSRALSTELWDIPLSTVPSIFFSATPRRQAPPPPPVNIGATVVADSSKAQNNWSVTLCGSCGRHSTCLCVEAVLCPCITVGRVAVAVDPASYSHCGASTCFSLLSCIFSCHVRVLYIFFLRFTPSNLPSPPPFSRHLSVPISLVLPLRISLILPRHSIRFPLAPFRPFCLPPLTSSPLPPLRFLFSSSPCLPSFPCARTALLRDPAQQGAGQVRHTGLRVRGLLRALLLPRLRAHAGASRATDSLCHCPNYPPILPSVRFCPLSSLPPPPTHPFTSSLITSSLITSSLITCSQPIRLSLLFFRQPCLCLNLSASHSCHSFCSASLPVHSSLSAYISTSLCLSASLLLIISASLSSVFTLFVFLNLIVALFASRRLSLSVLTLSLFDPHPLSL
ncbi:unnamed protein product [Closterium sp. NIES-65]|nr:unnamed protein product [Closterium sp. NIES-65]